MLVFLSLFSSSSSFFLPRSSTMNWTLTAWSEGLRSTMRVGLPGAGAEAIANECF